MHLAHARHAERGRERALAHGRRALERLDVDDDVGLGQRMLHRVLDRVRRRVALADGGVRLDADDDVGEVAARRLTHAQPAQLDGGRDRSRSRRRAASSAAAGARSMSTSTLRRISRSAAPSTITATKSAATESAC